MSLLANSNAIESGGYNIDRSLRFRSSASAYLSRTPGSTGNRNKFTYSGWVKRGIIDTGSSGQYTLIAAGGFGGDCIMFSNGNLLSCQVGQLGVTAGLISNNTYRDPSAWYHVVVAVDTTQATAANRVLMWVNNQAITSFAYNNLPAQNYNFVFNLAGTENDIGRQPAYGGYFDGYLAEVNFIDGQALTPSSFGETSTETGVWVPKKYTGTYGTNGFYLNFSDNTSATTLAYDKSGNGNNWTANNISTTAGATYDSMTDVPTLTSATVANYCVLNPLLKGEGSIGSQYTITNGNLTYNGSAGAMWVGGDGSIGVSSGKWYYECIPGALGSGVVVGWVMTQTPRHPGTSAYGGAQADTGVGFANAASTTYTQGGATGLTNSGFTTNDVLGLAIDIDNRTMTLYKNGVSIGGASNINTGTYWPGVGGYGTFDCTLNFGQRPFSYTPPTGFKALNTFNLPDPTIKKPNQYMDATLYTGNGGTQSITNAGMFQPDLVWVKTRVVASSNALFDSVRGATKALISNGTVAENNLSTFGVTAFNSNGFTVVDDAAGDYYSNGGSGGAYSGTPPNYVAWQWKKGATPGFDIVTYTGTGANTTVAHSLGVAPKMVIVKARSIAGMDWPVWHTSLTSGAYTLTLDSTNAQISSPTVWNSTIPTSSVFSVGTGGLTNQASATYVAYLFAEIPGFSKFGSYTGNGSADGPFVYCGFRPKYVMVKCSSSTGDWVIVDTARGTYNVVGPELYADLSNAEATGNNFDVTSNGFKLRGSWNGVNGASATYIYAAFAENPFKYSNAR